MNTISISLIKLHPKLRSYVLAMKVKVLYFLFFSSVISFFCFPFYKSYIDTVTYSETINTSPNQFKKCDPDIAPFYIYDLPDRYNMSLSSNCTSINQWFSLCPYYENHGMGQQFNKSSWYNTYQFNADLLFYT